ncbi:membrane protein insertion efficiency factor YidD [Maricaulis virginensis]|uniref:Putative membrane protein insertion efficiency factor n=1 Tax=Maricaulis virginensis TaxID=144022 RepID=A0A9W6MQ63_9PROT|nr:membrane protein insertion efficiency factor YidD [Maricaulis virginensis]GLK53684.1 putative membrane protein insertion efficiency factor [Maricaulis virginensis]|tara:strand:- start:1778 stop:2149 length:372 start_codon:yes stop_codon:yes gene_type:complete
MRSTERKETPDRPLAGAVMIGALRVYQWTLSPVFYALGVRCRHEPSCSHYAIGSVTAQGPWRGFWLALGRLGRCRPGGTFGFDPVPEARTHVPWWRVWAFRTRSPGPAQDELSPAGRADNKDM